MARRRKTQGNPAVVVGYVRVSTDDQALSLDAQNDALEKWCTDNERALVHVCQDRGVSGKADLKKRPGMLEAMAAVREYQAGILLVFRRDRLSRSVANAGMIEDILARDGVRVMSTDGVGNDDSPAGRFAKHIVTAAAEYERDIIALRTRVALHAKKKRGMRHTCRPPYGFRWTSSGAIAEMPNEQRTITQIVAMRAGGHTLKSILEFLEARPRQYPARTRWHATTVYRIVRRHEADQAMALDPD